MKQIYFQIDDQLADKFEIALKLTGEERNQVIEDLIRKYLGKAFSDAADTFRSDNTPAVTQQEQRVRPTHETVATRVSSASSPAFGTPDHEKPPRKDVFSEWGKAIHRIPLWAKKPQQNNHKILKAFLELQQEIGKVTIDALRKRCSDPTGHPETYVPHFDNNYAQMKFDNGNSHGKVFEESNGFVTVWDHISDTLLRYRDYFL